MEILTDSQSLRNCLEIVEKVLPTRSTMPVINNIYFEIKPDKLTLSATNLEMFISVSMPHNGKDSGVILLPPKIVDIMRYFPTPEVKISVDWENYRMEIIGGSARFHLFGADASDFPSTFENLEKEDNKIIIDQKLLRKVLKMVIFSASTEESRPAFNGVLINYDQNLLTLTASDTYRLAVKTIKNDLWKSEHHSILVPARSLREFLRISDDSEDPVTVSLNKKIFSVQFGSILFSTRVLEEKYPDVSGVIPLKYRTRIEVNRKHLEESVTRANLLAEGKNQAVNISITDTEFEIKGSGQEGSMEESITVEKDGEDLNLFVNSRYILDLIKVLEEEIIVIDFHGDGGPLVFRLPDDQDYLYLALPIKKFS
jgi:DNA polymerase III subunit beta